MTAITRNMVGQQAKANPARRKAPRKAASPAQLAARERFAEMARAGRFTKTKRKTNPRAAAKRAPMPPPRKRAPARSTLPVDPRAVNPSRVRGRRPKEDSGRRFEVFTQDPKTQSAHSWTRQATFYAASSAKRYALALHKAEPHLYVRVESHA